MGWAVFWAGLIVGILGFSCTLLLIACWLRWDRKELERERARVRAGRFVTEDAEALWARMQHQYERSEN